MGSGESIFGTLLALISLGSDMLVPILFATIIFAGVHVRKGAEWFLCANLLALFGIYVGIFIAVQLGTIVVGSILSGPTGGGVVAIMMMLSVLYIPVAFAAWLLYMVVAYPMSKWLASRGR